LFIRLQDAVSTAEITQRGVTYGMMTVNYEPIGTYVVTVVANFKLQSQAFSWKGGTKRLAGILPSCFLAASQTHWVLCAYVRVCVCVCVNLLQIRVFLRSELLPASSTCFCNSVTVRGWLCLPRSKASSVHGWEADLSNESRRSSRPTREFGHEGQNWLRGTTPI